ncbi:unnamed protein product [Symbiodinium sp. CCMP2592]|nr:unnamed protein product [Symbiodinium sp. CCMP2592]
MDAFLGNAAGATLQERLESLRNLGWIVSREVEDIQLNYSFTTVVQVKELHTTHHGTVQMVDLRLSNDMENVPLCRQPVKTAEEMPFDATSFGRRLRVGEVYMLVGAKVLLNLQRERSMRFPPCSEKTASILLPSKEDAIVSMMELFSGGFQPWTVASTMLPMASMLRVDNDGMAIASILLNDKDAVLHAMDDSQTDFPLFWGEVLDLRWTKALHDKNVEIACASPPSMGYRATGDGAGLKDGKASVGWMQLFVVARLTQRRAFIIEALPALATHEDLELIIRIMRWAGYTTIWHGFLDAQKLVPVERKRFFMVCWNTADGASLCKPFHLMNLGPREPKQCHEALWHGMPGETLSTVKLRPVDISKVTSRELLPKYQQNIPGSPLHIRIVDQAKPMPPLLGNYRAILNTPWVTLKKKGLHLPLVFQGADIRMLSRWELLKAFGLSGKTIMPDNEDDAHILLGQALTPAQAMVMLASVIGHRAENTLDNEDMIRYLDQGLQELMQTWIPFARSKTIFMSGWSMLIRWDVETPADHAFLEDRLRASHTQLKHLMFGKSQGRQGPLLPESSRVLYNDLPEDKTEPDPKEYRLFQVDHGYSTIILDEEDSVTQVNAKIAEFMLLPTDKVAVTKMAQPSHETQHWIVAGEILEAYWDKVLVLVDPAVPTAHWLSSQIDKKDLHTTFADHHTSLPDFVTLNDQEVYHWPISLVSGDFLRLRWDGYSADESWKELDVFKKIDNQSHKPPRSPANEEAESSPGGPTEDPDADGDHPTGTGNTGNTEDDNSDDDGQERDSIPPTVPYEVSFSAGTTDHDSRPDGSATKRRCTQESRDLNRLCQTEGPALTINYASLPSQPSMVNAIYMSFQHQLACFRNSDARTLGRIAEDEWGVQAHMIYFTLGTKVLSHDTGCSQVPIGATVIVRGRLRGGTGQAVQKLRTMLSSKGVPDENLDSRIQEIRSHIGDAGIKEAYSSWDPWSHLKAKVPTRLIKEAEVKAKPKAKPIQPDDQVDPMQANDPWRQALRERGMWKLETSFFKMEDGTAPPSLDKVTHGARGIAIVNEREAELLTQSQEVMSSHELAALVVGSSIQNPGCFNIKDVETPCRSKDNDRILVKAQLLNLGAKQISLQDEGKVLTVDEIDAVVVACEAVHDEMEDWEAFQEGPIKYLKKHVQCLEQGLIGTWARKFFLKNKQTPDGKAAHTCYFLMRIKREMVEALLKMVIPGVYFSPRNDAGALDPDFKVIWFNDLPLQEIALKANMEQQAFGIVRNKGGHGIRVRSNDYTKLKQKWQPTWKPMENTPYNLQVKMYYELQNMPLCCTKAEVQKFLNQINWEALALKQTKPRTWLIGTATKPEKLVHLAAHGTVLVAEKTNKGMGKGKTEGKSASKGRPWWVAGASTTPTDFLQKHNNQGQNQLTMDVDATDLEDRIQKKMDQMHQESMATTKLLRQDFMNFKKEVITQQKEQQGINERVQGSIQSLTTSLSQELTQCITTAMAAQRSEMANDMKTAQINLKDELMGEMRTQMGAMRKRTPSPKTKEEEAKKPKQPWYMATRVGEASNPGPSMTTTFSAVNAQSLNAFVEDGRVTSNHADVLVFTETAATTYVQQKTLKAVRKAGRHAVFSKPAGKRVFTDHRECVTKGEAKGAAVVSTVPLRASFSKWPDNIWESARVADTFLVLGGSLVLVIALYGYHQGLQDAAAKNEELLRAAAHKASLVRCPALIMGDLNCDIDTMVAWDAMKQAGWTDAAALQSQRDGMPMQNTFQETSRLDYVLLNDLALPAFKFFGVSAEAESDHKAVHATFQWDNIPQYIHTCRSPKDSSSSGLTATELQEAYVPAKHIDKIHRALLQEDVEEAWISFSKAFEDAVSFSVESKGHSKPGKNFYGRGRAVFLKQKMCQDPPKMARQGEFQPSGDDSTLQLRQRIRQIRRFQAFLGQVGAASRAADQEAKQRATLASRQTWTAICNAAGFSPCFREWWYAEHEQWFPQGPPESHVARFMLEALKSDEPHWRSKLRHERNSLLSSVFSEDWKVGGPKHYSAIKPAGAPKVDSLNVVSDHRILTRRSRQKGSQICTLLDDDLQMVMVGSIWKQGKAEAQVQCIRNGSVHISNTKGCFISGSISQFRPTAHPQQILNAACDYWSAYWKPDNPVDASDLEVQQAIQTLPQLPELDISMNQDDLEWALKTLCPKKARGMDGFSNYEMKNLPRTLRPYLLRIMALFNKGLWPKNVRQARMALLYKTQTIGDMATTRPITILATVYRIWAKIITRKMLKHIVPSLPKTLFGSVPGRAASDMVSVVQGQLEQALLQDKPLAGISLDFSKAYNTLPRQILEHINRRLGLQQMWQSYNPFLQGLERFFTTGKAWGEPIFSSTGVPEGCPIAVVQMIVLTWTFTNYLCHQTQVPLYTYVDDWILLSEHLHQLRDSMIIMERMAKKFGLLLSTSKSAVFATSNKLTRQLHGLMANSGVNMASSRNFAGLGVNFQTAKQASVVTRNERWERARVLLEKLQYMPWSQQRKTDVILRGIMPLIFYGVENFFLGKDYLRDIRSKCNHTVWGKKQYHLHYLTPLFSGSNYEPMIYVAKRRFALFLRAMALEQDMIKNNWKLSIQSRSFFKKRTKGPVSILQNQLHTMGWELQDNGTCTTTSGFTFTIWDISAAQFQDVFIASWEDSLLQQLNQKMNLSDLDSFSLERTQAIKHEDPMIQGFLKKVRLGGLFPNNRKCHVTKDEATCHFCGSLDTMEHRVYSCPGTEHIRQMEEWNQVSMQPKYAVLGGLSPKLPLLQKYKDELDALPAPEVGVPDDMQDGCDFFTDGSATESSCQLTRLCSWSVTQAKPFTKENRLIAAGVLPGRLQTVFRAELFAVVVVLATKVKARIFCDNAAVVKDIIHIQQWGYQPLKWASHADKDLLKTAATLLSGRSAQDVSIQWVKAHRQVYEACNAFDLWCIYHNNIADEQARKAMSLCPQTTLDCRNNLRCELQQDRQAKISAANILRLVMDEF